MTVKNCNTGKVRFCLRLSEDFKEKIQEILVKLRYEQGLTQSKVRRDVGINIARIECGACSCSLNSLRQLAKYYGYQIKLEWEKI